MNGYDYTNNPLFKNYVNMLPTLFGDQQAQMGLGAIGNRHFMPADIMQFNYLCFLQNQEILNNFHKIQALQNQVFENLGRKQSRDDMRDSAKKLKEDSSNHNHEDDQIDEDVPNIIKVNKLILFMIY